MTHLLPTKKPHVSFSEIREWSECPHRHKLKYVDGIDAFVPSPILDFGTAVHAACEHYLKTKQVDLSIVKKILDESWEKNKEIPAFSTKEKDSLMEVAAQILAEVPTWLDATFPGWMYLAAEELLYEDVEATGVKFKGLIDGVLIVPTKVRGKEKKLIWIIDWKTSAWGWNLEKRKNVMTQSQIILYKHFWSKKHGVDPKDVRCGFVILKKSAKPGTRCELISVSVGPVTANRSLKILNNAITGIKKGLALKNRGSCTYCDFKNTPWCP